MRSKMPENSKSLKSCSITFADPVLSQTRVIPEGDTCVALKSFVVHSGRRELHSPQAPGSDRAIGDADNLRMTDDSAEAHTRENIRKPTELTRRP